MAKSTKLSLPQFRKQISNLSKKELQELLCQLYSNSPEAADILNINMGNEEYEKELLYKAKEKVDKGFFTRSGKAKLALSTAKSAISEFKRSNPDPAHLLDLQLRFSENCSRIAGNYYNLPPSFYRDTETMYQTIVDTINKAGPSEGRALYVRFEDRLRKAVNDSLGDESGLHEYLESVYSQIKWIDEPDSSDCENNGENVSEEASSFKLPELKANEVLPEEEGKLFYKLWIPLLHFINEKEKLVDTHGRSLKDDIDPESARTLSQFLWDDKNCSRCIDDYLKAQGSKLSKEHQALLTGWKRHVTGRFILERHLKKGSILISIDDNKTYQVRGIQSSWDEMIPGFMLPMILETTLIPFYNVIIPDGLIFPLNISLGGGIKKQVREIYMTAKRRGRIISEL